MDNYILDENDCPRLATMEDYYKWQTALPEDIKTGIGFKLARDDSDSASVSTVYLGLDHGYDDGPPVLWETMVFCEGEDNNYCERATNRMEAMNTHKRLCEKYLNRKVEQ